MVKNLIILCDKRSEVSLVMEGCIARCLDERALNPSSSSTFEGLTSRL